MRLFYLPQAIFGLATFLLVIPILHAQSQGPLQITAGPPIPFSGKGFAIRVQDRDVGGPSEITVDAPIVHDAYIDLYVRIRQTTSSTFPSPYTVDFQLPGLPAGSYTVRSYSYYVRSNGTVGPALNGASNLTIASPESRSSAVEYFNAQRDHYFLTASANDQALLDAGTFSGWNRTGQSFGVYAPNPAVRSDILTPVCRYYGLPSAGLDTHFFSAFDYECSAVLVLWPDQWVLESSNAFGVFLPSAVYAIPPSTDKGTCPIGTDAVYRVYNNKPDANHRYTTSLTIRAQMTDQGWIPEGIGVASVGFCALPNSSSPQ
jgi:hypothetical protein